MALGSDKTGLGEGRTRSDEAQTMTTYEQAESIVLLHRLTGMGLVDCAYAVIPYFDHTNYADTMALTIEIAALEKRLDEEFKQAHS